MVNSPEVNSLYPERFIVNACCPSCGSNQSSDWFRFTKNMITERTYPKGRHLFSEELRNKRKLLQCNECSLIFQYLIPSQDLLKELYSSSKENKPWPPDYKRLTWARAQKHIKGLNGKILDIGANDGHFLNTLGNNFEKYAMEPTDANLDILRERTSGVYNGFLDGPNNLPESYFDVITVFDVAEHLSNVNASFESLNKSLKKEGMLIIETGNSDCLIARFFKSMWWYTDYIEHFIFFNKKSLSKALNDNGFELVSFQKVIHTDFSNEASTFQSLLTNLAKLISWSLKGKFKKEDLKKQQFIQHPFRVFWKDHFFAIARKK
jgi:SAM-dependent methyltransferase